MDMWKIQEKGNLAKELVKQGLAKDMDDALRQIDSKCMVKANEDLSFLGNVQKRSDSMTNQPISNDDVAGKVERIRVQLDSLMGFMKKYQEVNDANLRELDQEIKNLKAKFEMGGAASMQRKMAESRPSSSENRLELGRKNEDTSQYAVDKIFDNSHGKMERR